jgi:hypothetical protein
VLAEPDVSTLFIEAYKRCGHCGISKPVSEFSKDKYRPDGLNNKCRKCCKEEWQVFSARKYGAKPLNENRDCSQYLGIHIAERVLSNIFENVKRLPLHNHGYDFICNKGYKIDVKSACNIRSCMSFIELAP